MLSCQRCSQTHSRADAFLLTCRTCGRSWHHRCLMPPMEDQVLVDLIRATNKGDTDHDLSSWMCRRCKKLPSETPSAMSSRKQTSVASDSCEDSKNLTSGQNSVIMPTTGAASTADVRVKQESGSTVDAMSTNDRERNKSDRRVLTEAAPVKRTMIASKRAVPPGMDQPRVPPQPAGPMQPRDTDVQMADVHPAKLPLLEKKRPPQRPFKAARKLGDIISTSSEEEVEMQVDPPASSRSTTRATSQASQEMSTIRLESVNQAPPPVRAVSAANDQGREVRPAGGMAIPAPVNQAAADDINDDPEDLYGPPVERRIIRILPSLAEELREQQRRVAVEKERRRVPLAPDWILARHANDPLWKESQATEGRRRRKPTARKLANNGVNVNELMGCFTVENWVREHKT